MKGMIVILRQSHTRQTLANLPLSLVNIDYLRQPRTSNPLEETGVRTQVIPTTGRAVAVQQEWDSSRTCHRCLTPYTAVQGNIAQIVHHQSIGTITVHQEHTHQNCPHCQHLQVLSIHRDHQHTGDHLHLNLNIMHNNITIFPVLCSMDFYLRKISLHELFGPNILRSEAQAGKRLLAKTLNLVSRGSVNFNIYLNSNALLSEGVWGFFLVECIGPTIT